MNRPLPETGDLFVGIFVYLGLIVILIIEARAILIEGQPPFVAMAMLIAAPFRKLRALCPRLTMPTPVRRFLLHVRVWWTEERQMDAEQTVAYHRHKTAEAVAHVSHFAKRRAALLKQIGEIE